MVTAPTVITAGAAPSPTTRTEPIRTRRRLPGRTLALAAIALVAGAAALWSFPELRPWPVARESSDPAAAEATASASGAGETAGTAAEDTGAESSEAAPTEATASRDSGYGAAAGAGGEAGNEEAVAEVVADERPPSPDPASPMERAAVNRVVGGLLRAIEARDSAGIARAFGGRVPAAEWRMLSRMMQGSRLRIRHDLGRVGSTSSGLVVAEVNNEIRFVGQPGRVRPPRRSTWVMRFQSDKTGFYLVRIRQR